MDGPPDLNILINNSQQKMDGPPNLNVLINNS